jgi:folate-binding protein YgfZ
MPVALVPERELIRVSGPDAEHFLNNLLTCDVAAITPDTAAFGALLTPQGKIIADMFVVRMADEEGGGYILDVNAGPAPALLQKLKLYKLRAKLEITPLGEAARVLALWGEEHFSEEDALIFVDPRLPAMGRRAIVPAQAALKAPDVPPAEYHTHRIGLGVPDGGKDFAWGDAYPHEVLMDLIHGVSFTKGCYVGQEVVSRMQHKAGSRTRIIPVNFPDGLLPEWGVSAMWGDLPLGQVGSCAKVGAPPQSRGLAMLRLDRLAECLAQGATPLAGGLAFLPMKESWMPFDVPGM